MSGDVLSGYKYVYVNSGKTVHDRKIGPVTVSGVREAEVLEVFSGGKAIDTAVHSGGYEYTFKGAKASGDTVYGTEAGEGLSISTTVKSGGYLAVSSGGVTSASVVHSGGREFIYADSTMKNATIAGGLVLLYAGAKTEGSISFDGEGGDLLVSGSKMPSAEIDGFSAGDQITLAGIRYSKSDKVSVTADGEVTITAGTKDYVLNVAGATTADPTAFSFGPGSVLTTTSSFAMSFLAPPAADPAVEQSALPAVATPVSAFRAVSGGDVPAGHSGLLTKAFLSGETMAYAVISAHGLSV